MEFYVNGSKLDITLEDERTVGDVLRSFEAECARSKATTVSILVDGSQVLATNFDLVAARPLEEHTKFELGTVSQDEVRAAFRQQAERSRAVAAALVQVPAQLQGGKDKEANAAIEGFTDLIDDICHTYTLSTLFPELHETLSVGGKKLSEFFEDISAVLADFEQALKTKDTVLVGDLAEYEISPRLVAFADTMEQQQ